KAVVGITLDAACYEAELGTRTRLVEMMQHALPIVTTDACELSQVIDREGLGLTFRIGDAAGLARQIVTIFADDERRRQMSERARVHAATSLSLASAGAPLRLWVANPYHAGDRGPGTVNRVTTLEYAGRALARQALWAF